jgi:hypothetical protein
MPTKWLLAKRQTVMMSSREEMHKTRAKEDLQHWTDLAGYRKPLK